MADLIREARERAKLSQRELARILGVHPSAVGGWEHGESEPLVGHRIGLSMALSIRFSDLLPEAPDRVALVTDPDLVAIVRLIEQEPPERRAALLRAIALILEHFAPPGASKRRARARRPATAK